MKILSAPQIRLADQQTIAHRHITSADLMEQAAAACVDYILGHSAAGAGFIILCGKGNNGGDGLAIARLLTRASRQVHVYILEYTASGSFDFLRHYELLRPLLHIHHISDIAAFKPDLSHQPIIIDAILGTGINKPTTGLIAAVIAQVNSSGSKVIAIDVPSGLPVDELMPKEWPVVRATITLTFQQPKLAFLFPESGAYVGQMEILDIGLDEDYIGTLDTMYYFLQSRDIAPQLLQRDKFSNKGTFGHSLLIAGSYGKIGAAILSSHACLCSGTGLLTTHLPACGYQVIQTALPEAMVSIDKAADKVTALPDLKGYKSIGIGPGIGQDIATAKVLHELLLSAPCPLIIDADALNIISENKSWLAALPADTVITPHPKEFDRLTEKHTDTFSRLKTAQALAQQHKIIIVLKGAYTATILPDGTVWFNSTGNPALAKGGTGDVLTGIITALVSRGYQPREAAAIGVYIHGLSADIAIEDIHPESLLASDVVAYLSEAFKTMYNG